MAQTGVRAKGSVQTFSRQRITVLCTSYLHAEVGKALKVPPLASLGTWLCVFHPAWHSSDGHQQENG